MSTTEIIVVFSALMALIALVTIGIDWIGKPLKNRRFIPRMYRFDDEKLPVDSYGHPQLDAPLPEAIAPAPAWAPPAVYQQPSPVVVATVPEPLTAASAPPAPAHEQPTPTEAPRDPGLATQPFAELIEEPARTSTSAFTDRLVNGNSGAVPVVDDKSWAASGLVPDRTRLAADSPQDASDSAHPGHASRDRPDRSDPSDIAPISAEDPAASRWEPGMALDAVVDDERPSLATKAERYWKATAAALEDSHFEAEARDRMAAGKAPRRRNPRSGRTESMQLTGLRRGSTRSDVRMSWPDSAVDPWATS